MKHTAAGIVDPSGVVRKHGSTPGTQRVWFWGDITPGPEYARLMFVSLSTALKVPMTVTAEPHPVSGQDPLKLKLKLTPLPPELTTGGTQVKQSDAPPTDPDPCADTVCALALSAETADSVSMSATIRLRFMPVGLLLARCCSCPDERSQGIVAATTSLRARSGFPTRVSPLVARLK